MIKNFFSRKKDQPEIVDLDHPRKLKAGDAIRMGFDERPEISNQEYFVEKVTGLDLAAKDGYERRVFHLGHNSEDRPMLLWVDEARGGNRIAFAYGADQPHVETMIDVSQFGELFDGERNYLVEVDSLIAARRNSAWLADRYTEDTAQEVYWLDKDPKEVGTENNMSRDETACDYFRLTSKDENAAIEVFVFDGGQTDVYFVNYFPLYKIEEFMPS